DTFDHEVVALGGPAGKNNLFGSGADQRSDLCARIFNGFFSGPSKRVIAACGISKFFREVRQHRLNDARIDLRGGVIIKINRQLYSHVPFSCCDSKREERPAFAALAARHTSAKW